MIFSYRILLNKQHFTILDHTVLGVRPKNQIINVERNTATVGRKNSPLKEKGGKKSIERLQMTNRTDNKGTADDTSAFQIRFK